MAEVGPFRLAVAPVVHPVEAYALRLEAFGRSLTYSGDTGPCRALGDLAAGSDLLLAEASFLDGVPHPEDLHLTGREAGQAAAAAGVGTLVVTHVPPWYSREHAVEEASATFTGPVVMAVPGLVLTV